MKALPLLFVAVACASAPPVPPVAQVLAPRASASLPLEVAQAGESESRVAALLRKPLTPDSAARIALLNNRRARGWMNEVAAARARVQQAGLPPNPALELDLRAPLENGEGLQADVGLDLDFGKLLFLGRSTAIAQAELGAERLRVAGQLVGLATRARLALLDALEARRRLELEEESLRTFQAGWAVRLAQEEAGNVRVLDVALEKAAVEQARQAVAEADEAWVVARERLNAVLGLVGSQTGWTLAAGPSPVEALPEPSPDDERRAIEASLTLASLQARAEAQGLRSSLAQAEGWLPTLVAGVHGERDDSAWEVGGHLLIELPLVNRGQGAVRMASEQRRAILEEAIAVGAEVRSALREARARVLGSARRARHARTVVLPAWEEALAQTLLQYNAMQVGVYDLLRAQRDVIAARRSALEAEIAHARAVERLDAVFAGKHDGGLENSSAQDAGATWTDEDF